jgi:hypothetical protein
MNPKVSNTETLAYTIFGERFEKFGVTPPIPEDYKFRKRLPAGCLQWEDQDSQAGCEQ